MDRYLYEKVLLEIDDYGDLTRACGTSRENRLICSSWRFMDNWIRKRIDEEGLLEFVSDALIHDHFDLVDKMLESGEYMGMRTAIAYAFFDAIRASREDALRYILDTGYVQVRDVEHALKYDIPEYGSPGMFTAAMSSYPAIARKWVLKPDKLARIKRRAMDNAYDAETGTSDVYDEIEGFEVRSLVPM